MLRRAAGSIDPSPPWWPHTTFDNPDKTGTTVSDLADIGLAHLGHARTKCRLTITIYYGPRHILPIGNGPQAKLQGTRDVGLDTAGLNWFGTTQQVPGESSIPRYVYIAWNTVFHWGGTVAVHSL